MGKGKNTKRKRIITIFVITTALTLLFNACSVGEYLISEPTESPQVSDENTDNQGAAEVEETPEAQPIQNTDNADNTEKEDKILTDLKKVLNPKVAQKTYKVLKNKIGFTKMKYKNQMGDTSNYKIKANGYNVVITASDKLYRIFTPHKYTWYENGKVKQKYNKAFIKAEKKKAKEKEKRHIDNGDRSYYYIIAKTIVESGLKNPGSADFPSIVTHPGEIAMKKNGNIVAVQSHVDAKNGFGAKIRSQWTVQFKVYDLHSFSYEPIYLNIDGTTVGKYIKM